MRNVTEALTKEYIGKLDALSFGIAQRLSAGYGGARRAKGKGGSMEFSDFRSYIAGDDLRRIDWSGYARFDKLFVKLFTEEKQATINFFVDNSASMAFEDGDKLFLAKMLAASLGYIFLKNTDRVNLFACGESFLLARGGLASKGRFYELADVLDKMPGGGETNLSATLAKSREHRLGSGISFVFSDFFSADGFEAGAKALAEKGQAVVLVLLLSAEEAAPALDGHVRLVDAETNAVKDIRVTPEVLSAYAKAVDTHKTRIKEFCARHGFGYLYADTSTHPLELVGKMAQAT